MSDAKTGDTGTITQMAEQTKAQVAAVREEIKLRAHLLGMEAKDAWEEILLPQLDEIERRLSDAGRTAEHRAEESVDEQTRMRLHLALLEARDRWHEVEPYLRDAVAKLRSAGGQAKGALANLPSESMKLRAKLAAMDAEEAIQQRVEQLERSQAAGAGFARKVLHTLQDAARSLRGTENED